ncbi:MAG: hypothetical protein HC876_06795 [Chloroflexaceae bacterium]|nr:hypothetical protein [Chloroflexaceae bacterium]
MHDRSYYWYLGWILSVGTVLAVLIGVIGGVAWQYSSVHAFIRARNAWEANAVPHYRLVIERPQIWCQQDVEVMNEQIVHVIENNCPIESLNVSMLFDRIADLDGYEAADLFPVDTCPCRSVLDANVVYDPEYGYPTEVIIQETRTVSWREPGCWRMVLAQEELPACALPVAMAQPRITHILLIPLP